LLKEDAISCLTEMLLPLATLITPNIPEAELLTGMTIQSKTDMEQAGRCLYDRFHSQVLIKGGHAIEDASDVLVGTEVIWFHGSRIDNPNTHGTGCTLSSAIACGLAKGYSVAQSISYAKSYLSGALSSGLDLGRGSGPIDHGWQIQENVRSL
jgi:hydroxymethylpyrimidine/phosphomethylpyrimidine kinase